ncbi:uncharacterized protein BCR38DRAFT_451083 [Pseudomassariella vexata]|uniref:Rhodopsin domain-containing protein n=1 Tax=Pseudomassariella vexata TaxID=1141098 RepID=A0A1Y2DAQ6_9PEZI|nr:uncharacterized protein BCR38DRAFT_451083 [Pseudomassariella vexata]ORY56339.1 hypothetical protein BCR38DRAFT_451083 [Pseudomassariella vexata]
MNMTLQLVEPADCANRGPLINTIGWTITILSFAFLALRVYCKFSRKNGLWWDDHFLIASWLCTLTHVSIISSIIALGFGKHELHIDPRNRSTISFNGFVAGALAILASAWSKTSFALTLLRISGRDGWLRWLLWGIIVSMNVAMISNAISLFFSCQPAAKAWDRSLPGKCWDPQVSVVWGIAAGGYSGAMDFVLALLPWTIIMHLQMKPKEKIGVAVAMSMGILYVTALSHAMHPAWLTVR